MVGIGTIPTLGTIPTMLGTIPIKVYNWTELLKR